VAASPAAVDWVGGAAVAAVILTVGIVLFALRVAGGGDVKLLAATALWAGPAQIVPFLLLVSPDQEAAVKLRQSVPYGIAIAAGGLWVASRMLLG
jgi:prepilin peptidase CpaA